MGSKPAFGLEIDKLAQTLVSEELTGRQTDDVVRAL